MLIFLTTILASVRSIFQSRAALDLENLALRHQIAVLQRSAAKRLKLTSADRLLWICLSRLWHDWRSALAIVRPETVLALPDFDRSGPGRCGAANPDDHSFRAKSEI
jgi:putative transposase